MDWDKDKSLLLSRICVAAFSAALAALLIAAPWFWKAVLHRDGICWLYLTVTYLTGAPAAAVLWQLHRLLKSIGAGQAFTAGNVASLRLISWCCILAAAVYFGAGFFDWYLFVFAVVAAFVGLVLRVVKNVFAQAVALKEENDYTI